MKAMDATGETPLERGALPVGEPDLRWSARATSITAIERELARIWAVPRLVTTVAGVEERHVAARTSVMNLVVIARRPETGERCATTVSALTGRHPSRTLIISSRDPDGPNWLDARIDAWTARRDPDRRACRRGALVAGFGRAGGRGRRNGL